MKFFTTLLLLTATLITNAQRKYVTPNGAGSKDGSSWANAWNDKTFADLLITQPAGTEIWLAKGTYAPTKDSSGNIVTVLNALQIDTRTFKIPSGVKVIGGFAGNENNITERDIKKIRLNNETIFFGWYSNNVPFVNVSTFVYNLVTLVNCDSTTAFDGITCTYITNTCIQMLSYGNNNCSPQLNNLFVNSYGITPITLLYNNSNGSIISKPKLTNCIFDNQGFLGSGSSNNGMAMFIGYCKPEISSS